MLPHHQPHQTTPCHITLLGIKLKHVLQIDELQRHFPANFSSGALNPFFCRITKLIPPCTLTTSKPSAITNPCGNGPQLCPRTLIQKINYVQATLHCFVPMCCTSHSLETQFIHISDNPSSLGQLSLVCRFCITFYESRFFVMHVGNSLRIPTPINRN